jgi:hypothetical protein
LLHLVLESHGGRALVPIPKRSASPRPDVDTAAVVSLKVLDPNRPIREADVDQVAVTIPLHADRRKVEKWSRDGQREPLLTISRLRFGVEA